MWVTNASHQVWRYLNNAWQQIPRSAQDIGIGADGIVYVVGMTSMAGGFAVGHWTAATDSWISDLGHGRRRRHRLRGAGGHRLW